MVDETAMINNKTKRLPTPWSSDNHAIYYELDKGSLLCREVAFHNKDSVPSRNSDL